MIEINYATDVEQAIRAIGRTEDIAFSPDDTRIAIAAFDKDAILILEIEKSGRGASPTLTSKNFIEISSPSLRQPHGLCWVDNNTIAVANRQGSVTIFSVPSCETKNNRVSLRPVAEIKSDNTGVISTPGSLALHKLGERNYELMVCNTFINNVSSHILSRDARFSSLSSAIILQAGLATPDGIAFSKNDEWLAISNQNPSAVLIYRTSSLLSKNANPVGTLRGIAYPHGLSFGEDDTVILVADAGAPFIHVFEASDSSWEGERYPIKTIRVFSDEVYLRGRTNPQEGGPKGLDISADQRLIAITCEEEPLLIFDRSMVMASSASDNHDRLDLERAPNPTIDAFPSLMRHIVSLNAEVKRLNLVSRNTAQLDARLLDLKSIVDNQYYSEILDRLNYLEDAVYLRKVNGPLDLLALKLGEFWSTTLRVIKARKIERQEIKTKIKTLEAICRKSEESNYQLEKENNYQRINVVLTNSLVDRNVSGISRVCHDFVGHAVMLGAAPTFIDGNDVLRYDQSIGKARVIRPKDGETFLFPDASWAMPQLQAVVAKLRKSEANVIFYLYDIIPVSNPEFCPPELVKTFITWLNETVLYSNKVICASRASAKALSTYWRFQGIQESNMPEITWAHCGVSDKFFENNVGCPPSNPPSFLSVGTIEPRKNYNTSIDAAEIAWHHGFDFIYYIVGRYGWMSDGLRERILNHPEYGVRLIWLQACDDDSLLKLYKSSRALIFPSFIEGFGLPLVEAAATGLPLIVSDIPAFKELAGEQASFFDPTKPDALSRHLMSSLLTEKAPPEIHFPKWADATRSILDKCFSTRRRS